MSGADPDEADAQQAGEERRLQTVLGDYVSRARDVNGPQETPGYAIVGLSAVDLEDKINMERGMAASLSSLDDFPAPLRVRRRFVTPVLRADRLRDDDDDKFLFTGAAGSSFVPATPFAAGGNRAAVRPNLGDFIVTSDTLPLNELRDLVSGVPMPAFLEEWERMFADEAGGSIERFNQMGPSSRVLTAREATVLSVYATPMDRFLGRF